jgi:hypothetical protein
MVHMISIVVVVPLLPVSWPGQIFLGVQGSFLLILKDFQSFLHHHFFTQLFFNLQIMEQRHLFACKW